MGTRSKQRLENRLVRVETVPDFTATWQELKEAHNTHHTHTTKDDPNYLLGEEKINTKEKLTEPNREPKKNMTATQQRAKDGKMRTTKLERNRNRTLDEPKNKSRGKIQQKLYLDLIKNSQDKYRTRQAEN